MDDRCQDDPLQDETPRYEMHVPTGSCDDIVESLCADEELHMHDMYAMADVDSHVFDVPESPVMPGALVDVVLPGYHMHEDSELVSQVDSPLDFEYMTSFIQVLVLSGGLAISMVEWDDFSMFFGALYVWMWCLALLI